MTEGRTQVSQDQDQTQRETRIADVVRHRDVKDRGPAETVFRLDDVHVYYGKFLALRGVNLEISKNEITAFIGPSGCGKSTLIRCLNR
jgi:phosphate transport system ATP-binding protein